MLRLLQVNLNGCRAAQELMLKIAEERKADIVIVSEQYCGAVPPRWYSNSATNAAIYVVSRQLRITGAGNDGQGWVWVETEGVRFYSCYFSPNSPMNEFIRELTDLEVSIRGSRLPVVVAGDFNAKAPEWSTSATDRRGVRVASMASQLRLHTLNDGSMTFWRRGASSAIDVTFVSEPVLGRAKGWKVLDMYSHSDHLYIEFTVHPHCRQAGREAPPLGWAARKLDSPALIEAIALKRDTVIGANNTSPGVDEMAESLNKLLRFACDASMPRRGLLARRGVYWWSDDIEALRRSCVAAYRRTQRRPQCTVRRSEYKTARNALSNAIKKSKRRCWEELCQTINEDPWGLPYRIVRKKLRTIEEDIFLNDPANLEAVIAGLFPKGRACSDTVRDSVTLDRTDETTPVNLFTKRELEAAAARLAVNKAPGPDCIPNAVIRIIAESDPDILLTIMNKCLRDGVFPDSWKIQKLVLIPKGKSGPPGPSSYRPLCMLDGVGKLLERLVLQRLIPFLEDSEKGLSPRQFGFRPKRSTILAAQEVIDTIKDAQRGSVKASKHAVLVTLDIKNAFNTADWERILTALCKIGAPSYIMKLVSSYLSGRVLTYGKRGQDRSKAITAGVPQGSVLGPSLWNVMYDEVLRLDLPGGAKTFAFADDLALVVVAKTTKMLELKTDEALRVVNRWLEEAGLCLAKEKTEAVFFTRKRRLPPPTISVNGHIVKFTRAVKYLGIIIDDKLSFMRHTEDAAAKAARVAEDLARLMPNVGGPKTSRRRLYNDVVHSVLLYGAPVWAGAMKMGKAKLNLARVQRRSAIRVVAAYSTISGEAVLAIAGIPPIDLLAHERRAIHNGLAPKLAKEATLTAWQRRWDDAETGRWTHRLIKDLRLWVRRSHGGLSFHLTQMLSGHGCFSAYLVKIGKETSQTCRHCGAGDDDAAHTIFDCTAWSEDRDRLKDGLRVNDISTGNMVQTMLDSREGWAAWADFARSVMSKKEDEERVRQRSSSSST